MKKAILLTMAFACFSIYLFSQEVGSLIDARDGKRYFFIKINDQWWLKENMNIGNFITSKQHPTDNGQFEKYCNGSNPANCEIYGGLYEWDEMMDYNPFDNGDVGTVQGICPSGWHLPTHNEWMELIVAFGDSNVAGGAMKEPGFDHWEFPNEGASNASGFTGLPGGNNKFAGPFNDIGTGASFFSTSSWEWVTDWPTIYMLYSDRQDIRITGSNKDTVQSVRCVKNASYSVYLTFLNNDLKLFSFLEFSQFNTNDTIILVNSGDDQSIEVSSIYTISPAFTISENSTVLNPGDSVSVYLDLNPEQVVTNDTLFIKSNDPNDSLVMIPITCKFPLQANITDSLNVTCAGLATGTATVTPYLGVPPYQYLWDDPAETTDSTVTGLEAGIYYHVTVTDSEEAQATDSVILTENDPLIIAAEYTDSICSGSSVGSIKLDPSGGTVPYNYIWSNDSTGKDLDNLAPGEYSVIITDSNGCQLKDTFRITAIVPFEDEEICLVTVDPFTGFNRIIWERTPGKGIDSYTIYRETNTLNVFDSTGTSLFGSSGSFIDSLSDPKEKSSKYSIAVIDMCGNESTLSEPHSTMHLTLNKGLGGTNLVWSKYEGFEVQTYNIWRGSDTSTMAVIGSVSGSNFTYTDQYPLAGTNVYMVEVVSPHSCDPDILKTVYSSSYSNTAEIFLDEITDLSHPGLNIFPNPVRDMLTITTKDQTSLSGTCILFDTYGRILKRKNLSGTKVNIDCSDLPSGLYFIELHGPEIYRGRIIIE